MRLILTLIAVLLLAFFYLNHCPAADDEIETNAYQKSDGFVVHEWGGDYF